MRKAFRLKIQTARFLLGFLVLLAFSAAQTPERPPLNVKPANTLTSEWLVLDADSNYLVHYSAESGEQNKTYYQWVRIRRDFPFEITFPAIRNLSIFLNNQLIFKADSSATHTIDLTSIVDRKSVV